MRRLVLTILMVLAIGAPAAANRLADDPSPYLRQHADNPVDWYPWGPEALNTARREGKAIFVSVGYSACHWCHVMERESFEDAAIAAYLNAHFVSIKIDRETRPDLDAQFIFASELLAGSSGWPNSVVLTPAGDPFFAGGYFPPDVFLSVLQGAVAALQDEPLFVGQEAGRVTAAIRALMSRRAKAAEVTPELLAAAADGLLTRMDPFFGGMGQVSKFPREQVFLMLLDQAERSGDPQVLQAVTAMLDGMLAGGIHDHVGGGFHRYAVDPAWAVPHFEKMLYTQALTGRLLLRAWRVTGQARYRRAAERTLAYVLRDLAAPGGGFHAAQDADSAGADGEVAEGVYYTWTPAELAAVDDGAFALSVFGVTPEGDLDGRSVLRLEGGAQDVARLDAVSARMLALRAARPAPFLDRKIILSWNAEMIATLAEASQVLGDPAYLAAAERAARFILDSMQPAGGWQRIWIDGAASGPAQLADIAALGLAFVALHDAADEGPARALWLDQARRMARTLGNFGTAQDGYRMTAGGDGIVPVIPVDDDELAAGNAMALDLIARLTARVQDAGLEQQALRLAAAISGHAVEDPVARAGALRAVATYLLGEVGPDRHAAKGTVRIALTHDPAAGEVQAVLEIAEGWHVNAHQPLEAYFIPTDLSRADGVDLPVDYPEEIEKTLAFNDAPLALYQGTVRLRAALGPARGPRTVVLQLQACSDALCLQPEALRFTLW